jgi:hypothetical protein
MSSNIINVYHKLNNCTSLLLMCMLQIVIYNIIFRVCLSHFNHFLQITSLNLPPLSHLCSSTLHGVIVLPVTKFRTSRIQYKYLIFILLFFVVPVIVHILKLKFCSPCISIFITKCKYTQVILPQSFYLL